MFLLDDTQLINEAFLEDVNGILNTGEVPSLFNNEEMVAINEALTKPAQVRQRCTRSCWGSRLTITALQHLLPANKHGGADVCEHAFASGLFNVAQKSVLRRTVFMLWYRSGRRHQHRIPQRGVRLLHRTSKNKPACRFMPQPDWGCLPHPVANVPVAGELLHHRLVRFQATVLACAMDGANVST